MANNYTGISITEVGTISIAKPPVGIIYGNISSNPPIAITSNSGFVYDTTAHTITFNTMFGEERLIKGHKVIDCKTNKTYVWDGNGWIIVDQKHFING